MGCLALLATLGAGSATPGPAILVARVAIPAGTLIQDADVASLVETRPVAGAGVLRGLLTRPDAVIGRRTVGTIVIGEPVTLAALGGDHGEPGPLRRGERAIAVPIGLQGSSAAAVIPGDRVDIVASMAEGPIARAEIVAANVEVLSVARNSSEQGESDALLRIPARQVLRVAGSLGVARDVRLIRRATL